MSGDAFLLTLAGAWFVGIGCTYVVARMVAWHARPSSAVLIGVRTIEVGTYTTLAVCAVMVVVWSLGGM